MIREECSDVIQFIIQQLFIIKQQFVIQFVVFVQQQFVVQLVRGIVLEQQQFVVAVEADQRALPAGSAGEVVDITKRYNERVVQARLHQPLFRSAVIYAYERKCAVCRLPFAELLDGASRTQAGRTAPPGGLALVHVAYPPEFD